MGRIKRVALTIAALMLLWATAILVGPKGSDVSHDRAEKLAAIPDASELANRAAVNRALTPHTFGPSDAVFLITEEGWPKTYAAWGIEWVERINSLLPVAATLVQGAHGCDTVEHVGLSDARSQPKEQIVVFGRCVNGSQYHMTEAEVKAGTVPKPSPRGG